MSLAEANERARAVQHRTKMLGDLGLFILEYRRLMRDMIVF